MSKKEEILHKLNTDDRNYIKEKFKEKDKQITDLEAKLAESEVIIKGGKEEIKDLHRKINEIVERDMNCIQQLKQQLTEKDAEVQNWKDGTMVVKLGKLEEQLKEKDQAIENLQEINQSLGQTCNNDAKEIERLNKLLAEKEKEETKRMQDFEKGCQEYYKSNQTSIAELKKVKEYWLKHEDVGYYIDQQIKLLKGEK